MAIYENETRPVEGMDNVLISILKIENFTHEDQGKYSCYCYYNQSMVTSDNLLPLIKLRLTYTQTVIVEKVWMGCNYWRCTNSSSLTLTGSNIPWTMIGIIGDAVLVVFAVISTVIYVIRRSKNKYQLFVLV